MSQYALPTSMITRGGFTGDAAETTNLHNKVNDNVAGNPVGAADDATTYVKGTAGTAIELLLGLGAITDPGIDTGFTIRFRRAEGSQSALFDGIIYTITLYEGATSRYSYTTTSQKATAYGNVDQAVPSGNIAAITNFANLRIGIAVADDGGGNSNNNGRCTQIYLEAPDVVSGEIDVDQNGGMSDMAGGFLN